MKKLRKAGGLGLIFCDCRSDGWPLFVRQHGREERNEMTGYQFSWRVVDGKVDWDKKRQTLTGRCERCGQTFVLHFDPPITLYQGDGYEKWGEVASAIRRSEVKVLVPIDGTIHCIPPPSSQEEPAPVERTDKPTRKPVPQ